MADQEIVFYDEDVGYDDDLFYDGTLDPGLSGRRKRAGGAGAASAGAAAAAVSEEYILANIECGAYLHHVNGNVLEEIAAGGQTLRFRGRIKKKNGITSGRPGVLQQTAGKLLKVTASLQESNVRATIITANNNRIKVG